MNTLWHRNNDWGDSVEPQEDKVVKETPKTVTMTIRHTHGWGWTARASKNIPPTYRDAGAVAFLSGVGPLFETREQTLRFLHKSALQRLDGAKDSVTRAEENLARVEALLS